MIEITNEARRNMSKHLILDTASTISQLLTNSPGYPDILAEDLDHLNQLLDESQKDGLTLAGLIAIEAMVTQIGQRVMAVFRAYDNIISYDILIKEAMAQAIKTESIAFRIYGQIHSYALPDHAEYPARLKVSLALTKLAQIYNDLAGLSDHDLKEEKHARRNLHN